MTNGNLGGLRVHDFEVWNNIERTVTEFGDTITLRQRGSDFDIRCNGWELVSSVNPTSEIQFGQIVGQVADIDTKAVTVLIGGLGLGFTLRAVLDRVSSESTVIVSELLDPVVKWNSSIVGPLTGEPLKDDRVLVLTEDLLLVLSKYPGHFDAVLLDIDNGPEALAFDSNVTLYTIEGLRLVLQSLVPGGFAAFWSADRSLGFESLLDSEGLAWRLRNVNLSSAEGGPAHVFYQVAPTGRAFT